MTIVESSDSSRLRDDVLRHSIRRSVSCCCSPLRVGLYGCRNIGQKRNESAEVYRFGVGFNNGLRKNPLTVVLCLIELIPMREGLPADFCRERRSVEKIFDL